MADGVPVADELLMGDFSARVNARGFIQKIWHNKKDNKKSNGELMLNLTEFVCYHHIYQPVKKNLQHFNLDAPKI